MADPSTLLVTGTLAEPALRQLVDDLAAEGVTGLRVQVLNIQVAALLTTEWLSRKLSLPEDVAIERVVLPGYCRGDIELLRQKLGVPVELGPRDLRDLPAYFGRKRRDMGNYGPFDIQIIAEINHAPLLDHAAILAEARALVAAGADVIDVGCDPQSDRPAWAGVAQVVQMLRGEGMRVSVDSFHPGEVAAACAAGAELVLSVNSTNCRAAADWGAEVVVIPDDLSDVASMESTIDFLTRHGIRHRLDPVVEPIGFGFARSLGRYLEVRRRWPQAEMMMGVGNLSEMTEVDSAGVNAILIGFCQELNIRSVLTTQVINWGRSSVAELDVARRLMRFAVEQKVPPKHMDDRLVMLRDPRQQPVSESQLNRLAGKLTDNNVRLFADPATGKLHGMRKGVHAADADPYVVFDKLGIDSPSHAFYLGYEMAKAVIALTLGKNYTQDEAVRFGLLTRPEVSHHDRRRAE